MPPTRLPERPKPPTGQQMLSDIASADDNDVVFLTGQSVDLSDLTPTTPEGGPDAADKVMTQASLAKAERRESAQRAYHKALELLEKMRSLEDSPNLLESQFTHLQEQGQEVDKVIKDLQESSSHLPESSSHLPESLRHSPESKSAAEVPKKPKSKKKR